jgi:phosphate transport system substrate-binding protein
MKKKIFILLALFLSGFILVNAKPGKAIKNKPATDDLTGEIQISGAFALYPIVVKWADEFKKLHPNVRIDISAGGAGKGMTDALAKVVDLGMVSRSVHPEEVQKGAFSVAVVKDAVVPTFNLSNPQIKDILHIGLKRDAAVKIWITGEAKTWGDVLGNSSKVPVHAYIRSDACGAAETWAAWLGKKQEDLKGTAVFGDPGVTSAVQKDKAGIGYNNIAYAYDQKTKRPYKGIHVVPIDVNGNGKIDADEDFYSSSDKLIKAIAEGKYPSPPARDLYLVSNGKPAKPAVIAFLKFILTKGQQYANATGYIALPKEKLNKELKKL